MKVGVLALQGAVAEHIDMLKKCGLEPVAVKTVAALDGLDGLVIPGGESTTVGKLLAKYGIDKAIQDAYANGMAIFGTCTGLILMAKNILGSDQSRLDLMNITVKRNAYGRQRESFETDLMVKGIDGGAFNAVFIRAPYIDSVSEGVEVLAEFQGKTVLAREGKLLAAAFHPELTDDLRIHKYFLEQVIGN